MLNNFLKEIFYALTTSVLIFAILELIFPGIVLAYINFNLILLLWFINGIIVIVTKKQIDDR